MRPFFRCCLAAVALLAAAPVAVPAAEALPPASYLAACGGADAVIPLGETLLDWQCLRTAHPQIHCLRADAQGRLWLELADGRRVLYDEGLPLDPHGPPRWDGDVRASMARPYPLDPHRPPTPAGDSPGRRRSYALLRALYGDSAAAVRPRLRTGTFFGQRVQMEARALEALQRVEARLAPEVARQPALRAYLVSAGGFLWRRIAGEDRLSPHSFGIAIDLSPQKAPYWRWSRRRPHPLQSAYPTAIVSAFEAEGFVWGGKWHEYDLMHFEFRPEILCKARRAATPPDAAPSAAPDFPSSALPSPALPASPAPR